MVGFIDAFRNELVKVAEELERPYNKALDQAFNRSLVALYSGALGALPGAIRVVRSSGQRGWIPMGLGALAGAYGGGLATRALQKEKGERLRPDLIAAETPMHVMFPISPFLSALMFRKIYKDNPKKAR